MKTEVSKTRVATANKNIRAICGNQTQTSFGGLKAPDGKVFFTFLIEKPRLLYSIVVSKFKSTYFLRICFYYDEH